MLKVLVGRCEPTKGSKYSACIDLRASEDVVISVGETKLVGLGVCIDLEHIKKLCQNIKYTQDDEGNTIFNGMDFDNTQYEDFMKSHQLNLYPRSSLRAKGLIANTGIIDLDYKDEIKIIIHNPLGSLEYYADYTDQSKKPFEIKKGDRIAQIQLVEHKSYLFRVESDDKRNGGFGSTDNE